MRHDETLSDLEPLVSRVLAGEAATDLAASLPALPSLSVVEALRRRAVPLLDRSPRQGYALAALAYALAARGREQRPDARGWITLLGRVAITLAAAERRRARYAQAERLLAEASRLLAASAGPKDLARCQAERAWLYRDLDRYREAEEGFRQVIAALQKAIARSPARRGRRARDEADAEMSVEACLAYSCRGLGQTLRSLNRYAEACRWTELARDGYVRAGLPLAAARCEADMAFHLLLSDREEAARRLARAREAFTQAGAAADLAEVNHYTALLRHEQTHFTEALSLFQAARAVFEAEGLAMRAALTEVNEANTHFRMGALEKALALGQRARAHMAEAGRSLLVFACDVNLGLVYHAMGQARQALAMFERALALCEERGLPVDAARCRVNMALVYEQVGDYARALSLCQRARDELDAAGIAMYRAHCDQNLGALYLRIGQYERALERFGAARETFADEQMPGYAARCEMQMAAASLEMGDWEKAQRLLEQAQATCRAQGMALGVDLCDALLAEVEARRGEAARASTRYRAVRERLLARGLVVDAALCSVALGEIALRQGEDAAAEAEFTGALSVLAEGFPDHAWRAAHGLACVHQAKGDGWAALGRYREAAELIRRARASLWAEEPSASYFDRRRHVFAAGVRLAMALRDRTAALELVEDSKAQALFTLLRARGLGLDQEDRGDPYVRQLLARERMLRQRLRQARSHVSLTEGYATRGGGIPMQVAAHEGLAELARWQTQYAATLEALRAQRSLADPAPYAPPFNLETFRQKVAAHLPAGWAALAYYLDGDELYTFYLDEHDLEAWQRRLERYDALVLAQATDPSPGRRMQTYGARGNGLSNGLMLLRHLRQVLIPAAVEERLSPQRPLWIVPHGRLHHLPFHVLPSRKPCPSDARASYLGQEVTLHVVPSLRLLEHLACLPTACDGALDGPALICGVSDFGSRAPALRHAADEALAVAFAVAAWADAFLLLEREASLEALARLQGEGYLERFDLMHWATHAEFAPQDPLSSRILLSDGDLTVADILQWRLRARLVVLSACQSGISPLAQGDEMMGLLQALFCAGARAVLASLWPVDDAASHALMQRLYAGLSAGASPACALQRAQAEMDAAGFSPYDWAGFQLFGV